MVMQRGEVGRAGADTEKRVGCDDDAATGLAAEGFADPEQAMMAHRSRGGHPRLQYAVGYDHRAGLPALQRRLVGPLGPRAPGRGAVMTSIGRWQRCEPPCEHSGRGANDDGSRYRRLAVVGSDRLLRTADAADQGNCPGPVAALADIADPTYSHIDLDASGRGFRARNDWGHQSAGSWQRHPAAGFGNGPWPTGARTARCQRQDHRRSVRTARELGPPGKTACCRPTCGPKLPKKRPHSQRPPGPPLGTREAYWTQVCRP